MPVGPLAINVPQLDGSLWASKNCGPANDASGSAHASRNVIVPTPTHMRAIGQMGGGPTDFADLKRGIAGMAPEFAARGLAAPNLVRYGYISFDAFEQSLVFPSRYHIAPVNYGVILPFKQYRSDNDFTGDHFLGSCRLYIATEHDADGDPTFFHRVRPRELKVAQRRHDQLWTFVFDPLADGRRPSVPKGPQLWPLDLYERAADRFNDDGAMDGLMSVASIKRV